MIKISENEAHLWGATDDSGKILIPFVFDEITLIDDGYFCRAWRDYVWFDDKGKAGSSSRSNKFWINENTAKKGWRYGLDNVPMEKEYGVLIKYENGKFGVLDMEKRPILPCEFDEVWRWPSCDVLETRKGTEYQYFDLSGKRILTKHRNGPVENSLAPYTISEQQSDIALMTMEFVDSCYDEQCCICYGHPTRLDRILRQKIEYLMRKYCDYKDFPEDAFHRFNGWDTYLYRAYIAHGTGENPMGDCVRELHEMRCYSSSWFYLDKVMTNENTHLSDEELELLSYAASDNEHNGETKIGYGIDESLEDGEVKVFHLEYFADHWPSSDEYEGEQTFGYLGNCLNPLHDDWGNTKEILEKHQDLSSFGLLADIAFSSSLAREKKEITFCYNAIKWGLEYGWNPNEPYLGGTALEHMNENISNYEKYSTGTNIQIETSRKIRQLLIDHGATTLLEYRKRNPYYRAEDFRDYESEDIGD